ncbi:MAG: hypothetical protein HQL87_15085 [Magnetococcales bacterium]|nr:hypothetical protein [Magnetococcales bacterium]
MKSPIQVLIIDLIASTVELHNKGEVYYGEELQKFLVFFSQFKNYGGNEIKFTGDGLVYFFELNPPNYGSGAIEFFLDACKKNTTSFKVRGALHVGHVNTIPLHSGTTDYVGYALTYTFKMLQYLPDNAKESQALYISKPARNELSVPLGENYLDRYNMVPANIGRNEMRIDDVKLIACSR